MTSRRIDQAVLPSDAGEGASHWFRAATPLRTLLNRVFPDHWSYLLGEVAPCSFIVLLLTGIFPTLFFEPSMKEVVYDGSYIPLQGMHVSAACPTEAQAAGDSLAKSATRGGMNPRPRQGDEGCGRPRKRPDDQPNRVDETNEGVNGVLVDNLHRQAP
jgi:hypothetical protein